MVNWPISVSVSVSPKLTSWPKFRFRFRFRPKFQFRSNLNLGYFHVFALPYLAFQRDDFGFFLQIRYQRIFPIQTVYFETFLAIGYGFRFGTRLYSSPIESKLSLLASSHRDRSIGVCFVEIGSTAIEPIGNRRTDRLTNRR